MLPGGLHLSGALLGRSGELREIEACVDHACRGAGQTVVIEGEAGIGKTRLGEEILHCARLRGAEPLRGTAHALQRRRPFGVIAEALGIAPVASDQRRAEIRGMLLGELGQPADLAIFVESAQLEFRVTEGILALIEDLCAARPVVLLLDDLQWADPATLSLLHDLSSRVGELPILLILMCRPLPRTSDLEGLLDSLSARGARQLTLGPLTDDEVTRLAQAVQGAKPGPNLRRRLSAANGNPLLVIELLAGLQMGQALRVDSYGEADMDETRLPLSFTRAVMSRLGSLPSGARDVLQAASILGSAFSVADLALLLKTSTLSLAGPLRASLRAGVLATQDTKLAFRHELIREALYHDLPLPLRCGLHRQAARVLAESGATVADVAEHLIRGASRGDCEAVRWLHRAGRQTAPRAPATAAELLASALELAGAAYPERDAILADLATSLIWAGRMDQAEAICREVLERYRDPATEGPLRVCLAQLLLARGDVKEGLAEIDLIVSSNIITSSDRARALAWGASARMVSGQLQAGEEMASLAREAAKSTNDAFARAVSMTALAAACHFRGEFAKALDLTEDLVKLADQSEERQAHRYHVNAYRASVLADLDRLDEAWDVAQRGRQISEDIGAKWNLPVYQWVLVLSCFWSGRWDEAIAEFLVGLDLVEETGTRYGVVFGASIRSLIALHRDEFDQAEEALALGERELTRTGPQYRSHWVMWARALLLEAQGSHEASLTMLRSAWDMCVHLGIRSEFPVLAPDLVRLAVLNGQTDLAQAVTVAVEKVSGCSPAATMNAAGLLCRGLAESDGHLLSRAALAYRGAPRALEHARACEEAAAAFGNQGLLDEARPLLDEALDLYERIGARRDLARAQARLRAVGLLRGQRGRRQRPKSGWESLTPTEVKVADFVAEGLSNPQIAERMFISRRTVRTHVSHILAKVGLSSRVQLAAELVRRRGERT